MKIILIALMFLSACSNPNQENSKKNHFPDLISDFLESKYSMGEVDGVIEVKSGELLVDFGSVKVGSSVSKSIILTASSDLTNLSVESFKGLEIFKYKDDNCLATLKKNRSCKVELSFKVEEIGEFTESAILGSAEINFLINVEPIPVDIDNGLLIVSPSLLNLGDFTGIAKTTTVNIQNTSKKEQSINLEFSELSAIGVVQTNNCPLSLKSNRICQIKLSYSSSEILNEDVLKQAKIFLNTSVEIPLTVTHKAVVVDSSSVSWNKNEIDFGVISTKSKRTNIATATGDISGMVLSTLPQGVTFSKEGCVGILKKNRSCSIEIEINPSLINSNVFPLTVNYSSSTVQSSFIINAALGSGVVSYQPEYSAFGECSTSTPCSGQGIRERVISVCKELVNGVPGNSTSLSNCSTFNSPENLTQVCLSPAGSIETEITNGFLSKSCNEGSNVSTDVITCNEYYKNVSSSCEPKACGELTQSDLTSLGYVLNGTGFSGTYPSCVLTCEPGFQIIAENGKSCSDVMPSGTTSINSSLAATVYTNQNSVAISTANVVGAKEMSIAWDTCANHVDSYEPFSPSKTMSITGATNTSKKISFKYKNKEQVLCYEKTVFYDITPPTTPATLTVNGEGRNGNHPEFSWSASTDTGGSAGIIYEYAFGKIAGGTEIKTFTNYGSSRWLLSGPLENLSDGSYYITIRAKDRAGNYSNEKTLSWNHSIMNDRMEKVASGINFSCALKNGDVYCWGSNTSGSLGNNEGSSSVPVKVELGTDVVALDISVGGSTACAIVTPGRGLKCWGENFRGQVGNGTTGHKAGISNVINMTSDVSQVSVGHEHTCAIKLGIAYCWGDNLYGRVGKGTAPTTNENVHTPTPVCLTGTNCAAAAQLKNVTSISAGGGHTCAIANQNQGYCWGQNTSGQIGNGTVVNNGNPVLLGAIGGSANNFYKISAGGTHTCAIRFRQATPEAYNSLYCWGGRTGGALGIGASTGVVNNATTAVTPAGFDSNISDVFTGAARTCAIKSGMLYCWGSNLRGEIGVASNTNNEILTPVAPQKSDLSNFKNVTSLGMVKFSDNSTTSSVVCALDAGKVYCWGSNGSMSFDSASSVGDVNNVPSEYVPGSNIVRVPFENPTMKGYHITKIEARSGLLCVLVNGGLRCTGDNSKFQLGNVSLTQESYSTTHIPEGMSSGVTDFEIRAGAKQICAIKDMQLYCWGGGPDINSATPTIVSGLNRDIISQSMGTAYSNVTCVSQGGVAKCWGVPGGLWCNGTTEMSNPLGLGNCSFPTVPSKVCGIGSTGVSPSCVGTFNVTKINTNGANTCAIINGNPACWGESFGNGTTTSASVRPVYLPNLTTIGGTGDVRVLAAGEVCLKYGNNYGCAYGSNISSQYGVTGAVRTSFTNPIIADLINYSSLTSTVVFNSVGFVCGVKENVPYCWGKEYSLDSSFHGFLGDGIQNLSLNLPTKIGNFKKTRLITTGRFSASCIENNGAIFCWTSLNSPEQEKVFSNIGLTHSILPVKMNIDMN